MRWHEQQVAHSNALVPPGRAAVFSSSPRPLLRLDLRRSLLLHRRLALGIGLIGPVLIVVYMFRLWWLWWSADASRSLAPIEPTPAAVALNVLLLLFGFAILGAAVAVIAHELDQRVTIAADVERALDIGPMAQLPDFSQVREAATEEHLMRLATRIDAVTKERRMRNCAFTGAGFGAGTTTVAIQVKEALENLGRVVTIDDGAWNRNLPPGEKTEAPAKRADGSNSREEDLVLIDTAPIAYSAATERIMHRADCAIVVIESGVTTAAQLRKTASALQDLHLPFVGFVLNRVQPANADDDFRDSLKQIEQEAGSRKTKRGRQTLRKLDRTVDSERAGRGAEASTDSPMAPISVAAAISAAAPREMLDEVFAAKPMPLPEPDQVSDTPIPEPAESAVPHPAEEIPWWLREPKARLNPAGRLPRTPGTNREYGVSRGSTGSEWQKAGLQEGAATAPPRLSNLNGAIFSPGIKELDRLKHAPPEDAGLALLMSAIAPFEAMFNSQATTPPTGRARTTPAEIEQLSAEEPWIPVPDPVAAPAEIGGNGGNGHGPHPATMQPRMSHSMAAESEDGGAPNGENGDEPQQKPCHAMPEPNGVSGEFRILPSRRGQYKRDDLGHRNGRS